MTWNWLHVFAPAFVCALLLVASVLPWLADPLGQTYTAWSLPVVTGWGIQSKLFTYGILCVGCALLIMAGGYLDWGRSTTYSTDSWRFALLSGIVCFVPAILLVWQCLFADLPTMNTLAQHETQLLLVQNYFGYSSPDQFIQMLPFTVSASTLAGRLSVLVDVLAPGVFLPCAAGIFALVYARLKGSQARWRPAFRSRHIKWSITALAVVVLLVFFGRAPGAVLCEYVAQQSLATGNYTSALDWLNRALVLNPALDQVPDYHIARGNAWYYLSRDDENDDSRAYVAFVYQGQSNYLGAYDELLKVWHAHNEHVSPWIRDEMSITLERLSEYALRNTRLAPVIRYNPSALPWLQLLGQIDASNVYSQYVSGRIYYAQNSYDACIGHMQQIFATGSNAAIRSSAYTYIALSLLQEGKTVEARQVLFLAIRLDPYYHNNTAREELSGLH